MKLFVSIPQNSDVLNTFIPDDVKNYLEERFEVTYSPLNRQLTQEEIIIYAQNADAIMTGWQHCPLDGNTLKENRFRAVLDVFCEEPLAPDSELRNLKNVYCLPHRAGPTMDRRAIITKRLADDMVKFMNGEKMDLEITGAYASRMTIT